jgi:hypothetical protein
VHRAPKVRPVIQRQPRLPISTFLGSSVSAAVTVVDFKAIKDFCCDELEGTTAGNTAVCDLGMLLLV